ncbi:DUF4870 domain-containing protein [Lujinxingia vulgaris]|uniref:DUF4870 domain-containing protein n=1 Tax=Lujinxingia vulgaris TaxID=2600176 RepID=A0A5C6WX20_9DELT|nr:DUF4870 domain-containing protein [Lujinxingia vulgaris]TXD33954.1 DUF4870 domain-containing protein [Lujinxingia vulgaris]
MSDDAVKDRGSRGKPPTSQSGDPTDAAMRRLQAELEERPLRHTQLRPLPSSTIDAQSPDRTDEERGRPRRFRYFDREKGVGLAVLSYCSVLFGVPFFIVPLVLRDNPFSLHHAKAAGAIYLLCYAFVLLATLNCALFLPLALVAYIPALIGIYRASAGVEAGQAALGPLGERIFKWIEVKK